MMTHKIRYLLRTGQMVLCFQCVGALRNLHIWCGYNTHYFIFLILLLNANRLFQVTLLK
jgi:hypothetical protein